MPNLEMYEYQINENGQVFEVKDKKARDNLSTEIATRDAADAALETRMDALQAAVGSPLVASAVADMTDHDKIYVYVGSETGYTAGNWYYWDSSLTTPAWASGGTYNETALETDTTMAIPGMAPDSKVVGDSIADMKKDLRNSANTTLGGENQLSFEQGSASNSGGYISPSQNSAAVRNKGMIAFAFKRNDVIKIADGYKCVAYLVKPEIAGLLIVKAIVSGYVTEDIVIPENGHYYLVARKTDSSAISPAEGSLAITASHSYADMHTNKSDYLNTKNSLSGGANHIEFESGSGNFNSTYFTPTDNDAVARNLDCEPVYLRRGDVVKVANGYKYVVSCVAKTINGMVKVNTVTGYTTNNISIVNDGLYLLFVKRTDDAYMYPHEANSAITIEHNAKQSVGFSIELSKNPYANVIWGNVHDVTSVSHAHCTTQEQFETLKSHYDHIAISNYHPSFPTYPIEKYFSNTGDAIASPNAEHFGFSDSASSVHLNSLGSFLTCKDGGFVGAVSDMVSDTLKTLRLNCGGGVTLNHPTWSGVTKALAKSYIATGGIIAMEIWNATCEQLNSKGYSLDLWDEILSDGIQIYGTAVPDHEAQYRPNEDRHPFGYNHMLVINETEEEILTAYRMGTFYSSLYDDGLAIVDYSLSSGTLSVEVNEASTYKFVTAARTVSVNTASTTATLSLNSDDIYVRTEITRGSNKLFTNAIIL